MSKVSLVWNTTQSGLRSRHVNKTQQDTINTQTSISVTSLLPTQRCCQLSSKGVKVYPQAEWCSRKLWQCKDLSGSFCMCHHQSPVCWFPVCLHQFLFNVTVAISTLCSESPRSWHFTLFLPRLYSQQMIRGHHLSYWMKHFLQWAELICMSGESRSMSNRH